MSAGEINGNWTGLKALYHLEDANDSSGNGLTLTNVGTTAFSGAKFLNGANFTATNTTKYLKVLNNLGIDGGACTISLWVKILAEPGTNVQTTIALQASASSKVANYIAYDDSSGTKSIIFVRDKLGVADARSSITGALGTSMFYHVVYVYDTTNVYGFVNGVKSPLVAASGSGSNATTVNIFNISGYNYNNGAPPDRLSSSLIDEVAVFNVALSDTEIKNYYAWSLGVRTSTP